MPENNRELQALTVALSALAGFVDALGFITLGGVFVSFMSGNSTRFAVETADASWRTAALIGGIVVLFVIGVILGGVIAELTDRDRKTRKTAVLVAVTVLLAIGSLSAIPGWIPVTVTAMTLAMGVENSVFRRKGEATVALTYMTGALVKIGHEIASAFFGGPRWGWLPYLGRWGGLVAGGLLGALAHHLFGLHALWIATADAAALAVAVRFLRPPEVQKPA
ncbi:YoaK family protein [Rhodococcus sp. (in: high G+C Gram-positive bacteria)]|uniref:YoaK family protein n=1 Tax=Rhodococcus sp. TaxID=1831 RepID=UPI00388E6236